jgi:hypothetical protein
MLDTECWKLDDGCVMGDAGCWTLDIGCVMGDGRRWILEARYWMLVE